MFGIKTKKNKKIEEMQKDIDKLKRMLQPTTFTSEFVVPVEVLEAIPEEHIKKVLANKMLEVVEENLEIEHTTDKFKQLAIYTGKLKIAKIS